MDVDAASDLSDDEDPEGTAAFLENPPSFPSVAALPESMPGEQGKKKKRKRKPK